MMSRATHRSKAQAVTWLIALVTFAATVSVLLLSPASSDASATAAAHAVVPRAVTTTNLGYTPIAPPVRIADTRTGATDPSTYAGKTLGPGQSLTVDMPSSVPSNAGAVVAQLTAINSTSGGFLAAYPAGGSSPSTANVNFVAGQIVGNMVTVALGTDSSNGDPAVSVLNGAGTGANTDFTFDLYGYYAPQTSTSGASYMPLSPARIFDTRTGSADCVVSPCPGAGKTLAAGGTVNVPVTGTFATQTVPSSATAVVVNIAVVNTTAQSYLEGYPTGSPPSGSTLTVNQNWLTNEVLSTKAIIGVGTGGDITLLNAEGSTDVVVDVDGYFTAAGASGDLFDALASPYRLCDTRSAAGCAQGPVAASASLSVTAAGASGSGIPSDAVAGVLNVTDVANGPNYLTVYPSGQSVPTAADVNYTGGDTSSIVGNASYAAVGSAGGVGIYDSTSTANVVVDAFGYFAPSTSSAYSVSPSTAQTQAFSSGTTSPSDTLGNVDYTVTGIASGTTVDVALFPSTGADAPTVSNGTLTFAPTTANTAGAAAGQGTTNNGTAGKGAFVETVNAASTGSDAAGNTNCGAPGADSKLIDISQSSGQVTFTLNSFLADGTIPVVWSQPSGSTSDTLMVNANGTPQTGYAVGAGGSATWSAYAVSPSAAQAEPLSSGTTTPSDTLGNVDYTVTGIASGTTVDLALFPSTGANAPTVSNGTVTFTPTTSGTASAAKGQGKTNDGKAGSGAFVETVNGAGLGNDANGNAHTGAPGANSTLIGISPSSGQVTFTLNSFVADGTIPVVWSQPSGSTADTLMVNANGTPQAGYTVGAGGSATWSSTVTPAGSYPGLEVLSVDSSNDTFEACTALPSTGCLTFTYGVSGDSYAYPAPSGGATQTSLTAAEFGADLSGPVNSDSVPSTANAYPTVGTTTLTAATTNTGEDVVDVIYNPSATSTFSYANADSGTDVDVPAAPTAVAASYGAGGVTVSWNAVPDQNVSEDTVTGTTTSTRASYGIYRATVGSDGQPGTFTNVGSTTITSGSAPPTSFLDTTVAAGIYEYEVVALSNDTNGNALQTTGPASAAATVTVAAPVSMSTSVQNPTSGTTLIEGDELVMNFDGPVSVASTFQLDLRDGAGDEGYIDQTVATATLSNSNETVTYDLSSGGPHLTSGTALKITDLEAYTQTGVSDSAGQWNLPDSATGTNNPATTATSSLSRVFGGTNASIGDGSTVGFDLTTDDVSVTCQSAGETVNIYNSNGGTPIGRATCSGSAQDVTTSPAVVSGQTILATEVPAAAGSYESLATVLVVPPYVMSATTTTGTSTVALTYSEAVSCSATGTDTDWSGAALGGSTVTGCSGSGSTTLTLTLSGSTSATASSLTYSAPGTPSTSNAIYSGMVASAFYAPTQTVTVS